MKLPADISQNTLMYVYRVCRSNRGNVRTHVDRFTTIRHSDKNTVKNGLYFNRQTPYIVCTFYINKHDVNSPSYYMLCSYWFVMITTVSLHRPHLHPSPFTPVPIYARPHLHPSPFTPVPIYTRPHLHPSLFTPVPIYTRSHLHPCPFTPVSIYTRPHLHPSPFTPVPIYIRSFPFTPVPIYTRPHLHPCLQIYDTKAMLSIT